MKTNKTFTAIALSFALLFAGCTQQKDYVRDQYTSEISCIATTVVKNSPNIVNPSVKQDRKSCTYCKGSGILKSGDGIIQEVCPYCEVKGSVRTEVSPVKQEVVIEPKRCSEDCICTECNCRYPAECIINKNNGWAVQVCDETSCRVYYPQNSVGTSYNPYDLLTPAQKARPEYKKYAKPIKVDVYGEEIQPAVTQQSNATTTAQPIRRMRSRCSSCAR